jgi:hypothetical protein
MGRLALAIPKPRLCSPPREEWLRETLAPSDGSATSSRTAKTRDRIDVIAADSAEIRLSKIDATQLHLVDLVDTEIETGQVPTSEISAPTTLRILLPSRVIGERVVQRALADASSAPVDCRRRQRTST